MRDWEPWQRNERAIYVAVLITQLSFTFFIPFAARYAQLLGVTDPNRAALWAGLLVGISPFIAGILTPFWARLAARTGSRPMILRALVTFVIIYILLAVCTNIWQAFLLRAVLGIFAGFNTIALATITVTVPKERVSQAIGTLQSVQFFAAAIGPIGAGFLADTVGLRQTILIASVLNVLACVVFVRLFDATHDRAVRPRRKERASFVALGRLPGFLAVMVMLVAVSFIERTFGPLIPLYVQELHAPARWLATISGAVVTLGSLAAAAAASMVGRFSRDRSPRTLLLITCAAGALVLVPITLAQQWWQLLLLRPVLAIFIGGNATLVYAIAARMLPTEWKVTAFGTLGGLALIGFAVAPFATGAITDATQNLRTIFGIDAVLYAVLLAWAWLAIRLPADEPLTPLAAEAAGADDD